MKYIIGVDGGGTKTESIAYNLEGKEVGRGYSAFGNLVLNEKEALNNIIESIEKCKAGLDIKDCEHIYLGLAGVEAGSNKEKVNIALKEQFDIENSVSNDADIALAALLKGEDGMLTISGTGSICYGTQRGRNARAGGWGHILGDEGSGYYIALQGFKNMISEDELGLSKSNLTRAYMEKLNIKEVEDIKEFIYSSTKADIASFAPFVVSCAEQGEKNSILILKQAGADLAHITESVHKKLCFQGDIKVGIKGSILTNVNIVKEEFKSILKRKLGNINIIEEEVSSTKGAYYLWNKNSSQK